MPVFKSTRLLDQLREQIRYLHYSLRTEEAYTYWVKKFIHFHKLRHPRDMGQPEVVTRAEVQAVLSKLDGSHKLLASLLYGCGMRLMEGLRLRVKDVDFDRNVIIVRDAKGGKDRVVMLPHSIAPALQDQFRQSHALWAQDRAQLLPGVELPHALEAKYPKAGQTWAWHWVFAQATVSTDPRSKTVRRHHAYDQTFQRAFEQALNSSV